MSVFSTGKLFVEADARASRLWEVSSVSPDSVFSLVVRGVDGAEIRIDFVVDAILSECYLIRIASPENNVI